MSTGMIRALLSNVLSRKSISFTVKTCSINHTMSLSTVQIENGSTANNRIAICHMRSTNDKNHNRSQVESIVKMAKEKNSKFVFLPECCDFVGTNPSETLQLSESLSGDTMEFYKTLAKQHNLWLSIGGFHEIIPNSDKIQNTHVVINDAGELIASYRKLHLFDVDTPEFKFRESRVVQGGQSIVAPICTPIGQIGLLICYDLRFTEVSTLLRRQGADILTYPSAFAMTTGRNHWEVLLRARAIENQCYVIASAQIGFHNKKRESYGHAIVIDPWGKIIAQCDNDKDLDVVTADIDLSLVTKTRQSMPCFEHRRSDVYSLVPLELSLNQLTNDFIFEKYPVESETIFYETHYSVAFTNIRCVVPGHVLVVSKRKVERLHQLTADEIADFFQTVCKIQKLTEQFYGTTSSTVTVQDGEHAGQTVKHVHCHIMPRKHGDFLNNDEIYAKLNKHDQCIDELQKNRRSLNERTSEAEEYRKLLNKNKL